VVGSLLIGVWLLADPRTADLAAAVYRSRLFAQQGVSLWDNSWFAGHHLLGYSLIFPALGSVLGPRTVGALAALCSVALFSVLVHRHAEHRERLASLCFAVTATGDLFIGRLTFALGVACGLAAVTAYSFHRRLLSYTLSAVTTAASPVVGPFLAMVAVAAAPSLGRRQGLLMATSALSVTGLMTAMFPEGGEQPYDLAAALAGVAVCTMMILSIQSRFASVRRGAVLYLLAIVLSYTLPTPMGSNVARLGVLFGGPLLLCTARPDRPWLLRATGTSLVVWTLWGPVTEVIKADRSPASSPAYFRPLEQFLTRAGAAHGRIEVVPTSTRWESVYLAGRFQLARGWETQLDHRRDRLFYHQRLDAATYRDWLHQNAVRFVALADAPLERWGLAEARLLAKPHPWLQPVWRSTNWRVFAVTTASPLLKGPMRLKAVSSDGFVVHASGPGQAVIRVRYTPFWSSTGPGCVAQGPRGWTLVRAHEAGTIRAHATWTIGALLRRPDCADRSDDVL
jgi:hypothetical protein